MAQTAQADAARSNVSPQFVAQAERDFVESLEKLETAKGKHRNLLKQLKAGGINIDMLKTVVSLKRQDPEDVLGNQKDFIRYAKILALPIGAQLTLLDEEMPDDELGDEDRQQQEAWDAGQQGLNAGKAGKPESDNKHTPGSLAFAAWAEGHRRGTAIRTEGGVGKRGRPKKVTDTPEGTA